MIVVVLLIVVISFVVLFVGLRCLVGYPIGESGRNPGQVNNAQSREAIGMGS